MHKTNIQNDNQFEPLQAKMNYIFVVGHMRSYSSLLSHILGSHKDISGYAEMQQSYYNLFSFLKLNFKVFFSNKFKFPELFILDKILHNEYKISEKVISRNNIFFLFMIRNPMDAISSIISLGKSFTSQVWFSEPDSAVAYYINRLKQLEELAIKAKKEKTFFIESEDVIHNTEKVLKSISQWLSLDQELTSNYSVFKYTGQPGFSDTSEFIFKGKVIIKENKNEFNISKEILKKAEQSYQKCKNILKTECNAI